MAVEELAGRVAVVTGAASGIGRGIVGALAAQGMRIVAADLDAARLAVTGVELRRNGAEVIERVTDVRDAAAVQALAAAALEAYGTVHVICNNAGVWTLGYQWETDLADWSWVVDVNLWGVIHGVRTFVPILLRNAEGGHVVNTASLGGIVAGPLTGPYAATKHAIVGLSKSLRAELMMSGAQVGVSVVCPGKVRTSILNRVNQRPESAATPELRTTRSIRVLTALSPSRVRFGRGPSRGAIRPDEFPYLLQGAPELAAIQAVHDNSRNDPATHLVLCGSVPARCRTGLVTTERR